MPEQYRTILAELRADVAACVTAIKSLEERTQGHHVIGTEARAVERLVSQIHGRLERLERDFVQLDHVVQTQNGGETLVILAERQRLAMIDLRQWQAQQSTVLQQIEKVIPLPADIAVMRLRVEQVESWRKDLQTRFWTLALSLLLAFVLGLVAVGLRFHTLEQRLMVSPPPVAPSIR